MKTIIKVQVVGDRLVPSSNADDYVSEIVVLGVPEGEHHPAGKADEVCITFDGGMTLTIGTEDGYGPLKAWIEDKDGNHLMLNSDWISPFDGTLVIG